MTHSVNNQIAQDLRDEYRDLAALCATLDAEQWQMPSDFYGWTAWDQIAHLRYFDETALQSALDHGRFTADAMILNERVARGEEMSAIAREAYGHLAGPALLAQWQAGFEGLCDALLPLDPKARLAWYGLAMSARSFATARLMETWAHGQDVWDVLRRRRPASNRLKHIAHLGVTTLGWTFANRGLPVPPVSPYICLDAPDGSVWTWGDAASPHQVLGSAQDFCLLVTQRRHVDDTGLTYTPGPVSEWLHIAQCFAGSPADGPKPGERKAVV